MAKVHRMHRHDWWVPSFKQRGWMQDVENGTFGQYLEHSTLRRLPLEVTQARYVPLPLTCYEGDGVLLDVPCENLPSPVPARPNRRNENRVREPGIPPNVDIDDWYAAYQKRETMREEKQVSTGKEKREYWREMAYQLYRASGHTIDDSLEKAYSAQGDELIRYLSDDKRHTLNRDHEDEEAI